MPGIRRALGVDYGRRRIGLALTDPLGLTAQPLLTLTNRKNVLDEFAALAKEREVAVVVIGLPKHMHGEEGVAAEEARAFGARVAERTGLPVEYIDERLTTAAAQRMLSQTDMSGAKKRAVVDKLAAALLLQTWLERQKRLP